MPSLVWCPPGWCCGNLYLVSDPQGWTCPYSGVKPHTLLTESDWLSWSKPGAMVRLLEGQPRKLDLLSKAARRAGLESLLDREAQGGSPEQRKYLCDLLRDLNGNPFRSAPHINPSVRTWNSGCVVKLATAAYEERVMPQGTLDPVRLAVLADGMEQAGVTDQEILGHLRQPGLVHVRGCHVLDAILDKV